MRPFFKVRLSDNSVSHDANRTLEDWKRQRGLSAHLPKAILLYAALLRGDISLLKAYFPWIELVGVSRLPNTPRPKPAAPMLMITEKPEAEQLNDALDGLGLDELEI